MSKQSAQAEDIAMRGGGYYSLATIGAKDVIDGATHFVLNAIDEMPLDSGRFTLTDMGTADGGTSLNMIRAAIGAVRKKNPACEVAIVYADQLRNDYNTLFQIVHGATDFKSYADEFEQVHMLASAAGFYRQIVPSGSLNLGFSATAMHWLSEKPGDISNHVHMVGAEGAELAAYAEQGRKDWETILLHRAAELAPGGRLVLLNFGRDEQGRYLGNTGGINMFDTFNEIWQSLVDDGVIEHDEYVKMTIPQYYNTVEEFSAPLMDSSSPVHKAGLRLEHIETRVVPCPYAEDFKQHGDAAKFAREYIPTLRSWNEATYFGGLSTDRPLEQRQDIIEQFYGAYEARVRDNPAGHAMDYVHAYMVIEKE